MNDLEINRIRRLENQVNALTQQLMQANEDIVRLHVLLGELTANESPGWQRLGQCIEARILALRSLTPRERRY